MTTQSMMDQLFSSGDMYAFVATRDFSIGNPAVRLHRGSRVHFDGIRLKFGTLEAQTLPQFRSVINSGWAVLADQYDPEAAPERVSANIQMRPAVGGNPQDKPQFSGVATVDAEEREVARVPSAKGAAPAATSKKAAQRQANSGVATLDEGVVVATLNTRAGRDIPPVTVGSDEASDVLAAANRAARKPPRGRTREDILASMDPEQQAAYKAQIAARKAAHPGSDRISADGLQPQVVATLNQSKEPTESLGIKTALHVGGGTDTVDLSGLDEAPATAGVVVSEGMTFRTTNTTLEKPRPKADLSGDPRRIVAKSICKDFPDSYDFDAPLKKKLARLQADFEDRPDVIRAVAAAETDAEMKQRLIEEFPEAFE